MSTRKTTMSDNIYMGINYFLLTTTAKNLFFDNFIRCLKVAGVSIAISFCEKYKHSDFVVNNN